MNSVQVTACQPAFNVLNIHHSCHTPSMLCVARPHDFQLHNHSLKLTNGSSNHQCVRLTKSSLKLTTRASRYRQCTPVCVFGGKGKSGGDSAASPWEALDKAMGSFKKEQSLEEAFRQRIEKQEYVDDGSSDGNPPGDGDDGGGGGGGGDGDGNFGGPEDESFSDSPDEPLQVFGATLGIIFLYCYILDNQGVYVIIKDVLKLMVGFGPSNRLRKIASDIGRIIEMARTEREEDPYCLEREIFNTTTWWDGPEKYESLYQKPSNSASKLESSRYYENGF